MSISDAEGIYENYPIFRFIKRITFFTRRAIVYKSLLWTILFCLGILLGSLLDGTLILSGENWGLLQHPTIWAFFFIQAIVPFSINFSLKRLFLFLKKNDLIDSDLDLAKYIDVLKTYTTRSTNLSRMCYYLLFCVGVICFAWNSYQNQAPYKFVGFDFWDSINHPFGYWTTRLYKIYLWLFFLPALVHIQFSILMTVNKLLKEVKAGNRLRLKPYHQDGYGGVGRIIKIVINPVIPVLIISCCGVIGVFIIHRNFGITLGIGLLILSSLFIFIYLVPAVKLRKIIIAEKKRQLTEISNTQNSIFYSLIKNKPDLMHSNIDVLNALEPVTKQIKSISNWPYLNSVIKVISIVNTPIILSGIKQLVPFAYAMLGNIRH